MQHNKEFIAAQARIFKALGHPSRLLMVDALRDGEKCVCDLQALVGDDMSTISKHLAVLRDAGVVTRRKQGVNIYYSLALCCLNNNTYHASVAVIDNFLKSILKLHLAVLRHL